jgi:thiol-disulfide isomerase/thioredoxin
LLLVDFTGSDWCGYCIRLRKEVFDTEEFKTEAVKQFILVEVDYPKRTVLPDELKKQNIKLIRQYKVRAFPTILVMDADGEVIAHTGYRRNGPEEYVTHLAEFVTIHGQMLEWKAQLDNIEGLDRARILDQLVEACDKLRNKNDEVAVAAWGKEIIGLDKDNETGLKTKYEIRGLLAECNKLNKSGKLDEAQAVADQALVIPGITGEQKQDVYSAKSGCLYYAQDFVGLIACLRKGIEAAPEGPKAEQMKGMMDRYVEAAESQKAMVTIRTDLEKATGIDRVKLLDKLIELLDAQAKLVAGRIPVRTQADDPQKYCEELVALDPDNKAGLTGKYQVRVFMFQAKEQISEQNADQAIVALDKVLAAPGITRKEKLRAFLLKADCFEMSKNPEKQLECLKQAQEANPKDLGIKVLIGKAEKELQPQQ